MARWLAPSQLNDELKSVEAKHETTSGSVEELTEALSVLSDELQELKEKMDSKGDTVGIRYYTPLRAVHKKTRRGVSNQPIKCLH